jgi:hypothetical protein
MPAMPANRAARVTARLALVTATLNVSNVMNGLPFGGRIAT